MKKLLFILFLFILIGIIIIQKNNSSPNTQYSEASITGIPTPAETSLTNLDPEVRESIVQVIDVKAANNTFTPEDFTVPHLKSIILKVEATDMDYTFNLNEFNIHTTIPKGQIVSVRIPGLGNGHYTFECGTNCRGTITVREMEDAEDETSG